MEHFLIVLCLFLIVLFGFTKPKWLFYVFIASCVFQAAYFYRWTNMYVPRIVAWIPFLLAGITTIPFFFSLFITKKNYFNHRTPVGKSVIFVFLLTCVGLFSCMLNNVNILTGIFGLRYTYLLVLTASFLYIYKNLNLNFESLMKFTVFIGLFQIPFVVLERVAYSGFGIVVNIDSRDLISGTFTSDTPLAFLEIVSVGFVFSYWIRTKKALIGKHTLPLIIILLIPLFLSNVRAVFLFLFLFLLFLMILYRKIFVKNLFFNALYILTMLTVALVGLVFIFGKLQKYEYGRELKEQYSLTYIVDEFFRPTRRMDYYLHNKEHDFRMGRGTAVRTAVDLISRSPLTLFFGLGSGNAQESKLFGKHGEYYEEYGPMAGLERTQISLILAETGLLGILIYFMFFIWLNRQLRGLYPKNGKTNIQTNLAQDIYGILVFNICLFSIYDKIMMDYIFILIFGYFIAALQQEIEKSEAKWS